MSRITFAILLGLMTLGVWPGMAAAPTFFITIESGAPYFFPASATVTAGAPIRWDNPTATTHTVTHDGCLQGDYLCAFDSGTVMPNGSFSLPSLPPGRYPYHCQLHPIMRGVLIVTEPSVTISPT